jgi:D-3-phosphoglycerate dehydrogenase
LNTQTILVTAPALADSGMRLLAESGCRALFIADTSDTQAVDRIAASEPLSAIISRTMKISAAAINACPTLKVISKHGVGVDNIDVAAATARRIPVLVAPSANAQSVAEQTIALMLATARTVTTHDRAIRAGKWSRSADGLQMSGRTLGLVGFGDIGRRVARIAQAMGMRVIAFDPALRGGTDTGLASLAGNLDELLSGAEVLSIHCPLNAATAGMIGARELALLPRDAIVINAARGGILDEHALAEALSQGRLFGAGIDCFAREPVDPAHPLLAHPNVVSTPHMGGSTREALGEVARLAVQHALDVLMGETPASSSVVNPSVFAGLTTS